MIARSPATAYPFVKIRHLRKDTMKSHGFLRRVPTLQSVIRPKRSQFVKLSSDFGQAQTISILLQQPTLQRAVGMTQEAISKRLLT